MEKSKRNLAKAFGVVGAASTIWVKPVVDIVSLPAHATTTGCGSGTAIGIEKVDADLDNINIIFDGASCSITNTEDKSGDPDVVISLDLDATGTGAGTWDNEGPGANWSLSPNGGSDLSDGNQSYTATRLNAPNAGAEYDVTFDVEINQTGSGPDTFEMIVSNVQFTLV